MISAAAAAAAAAACEAGGPSFRGVRLSTCRCPRTVIQLQFRMLLLVPSAALGRVSLWPPEVLNYRKLLQSSSKDVGAFAHAAGQLRGWMAQNDPDFPLYHLSAPEGWAN